jgi:transposase-like protein
MPGDYSVTGRGKGLPGLKCLLCGEIFPMQSNLAIAEELLRISAYLEPVGPVCRNPNCELAGKSDVETQGRHTRYGVNRHGTPRYKCGACRRIFTHGGRSTKRQRETYQNRDIFRHLVNTVPLRRIIKLLGISTSVLYARIDFIYQQCLLFGGERERTLLHRDNLGRRRISTDRQKLLVNWASRKQRKNTVVLSIASADQDTGYLYGAHLNFDAEMDEGEVAADLTRFGDHRLDQPFRRYARVWLEKDDEEAAQRGADKRRRRAAATASAGSLVEQRVASVETRYDESVEREVIDDGEEPSPNTRLPTKGMLLHEQVVMNAHIRFVSRLLHRAEKIRFYLDQESGLRAAFMAALSDRILSRTADAFYVQITKDATVDQKRGLVGQSVKAFRKACDENPGLADYEVEILHARRELDRMRAIGKWSDKWFRHPIADMREPAKLVCWLTDIDPVADTLAERENQLNHAARLYLKASLTEIDRFFMQLRRALTMAERGVISASADRRLWFGKNAYNPGVLAKLVEIFRVYFNYCEVGDDKKTPAMRMGLARGPVAEEDILYFVPGARPRRRQAAADGMDNEENPSQPEAGGATNEAPDSALATP